MIERCPRATSARTMAEPTRPRWPATNTDSSLLIVAKDSVSVACDQLIALSKRNVRRHHFGNQVGKGDLRLPAELGARLRGISHERIHLRRTKIPRVDSNDCLSRVRIDPGFVKPRPAPFNLNTEAIGRALDEVPHRVLLAGGNHEVFWFGLLQYEPLCAHVVAGMSPVAARVEIAQIQALLESGTNSRKSTSNFS